MEFFKRRYFKRSYNIQFNSKILSLSVTINSTQIQYLI